ncbi:hypothetical protein [Pseudomonas sp. RIT-PI-S]|uniref:hypothetical protein n=1 Tax=Pseudomonas sp. RIT-PI-S TaxID=3035295 RepID=UPI0021DAC554|nr:hypothetical protein [Pseudomonas sp. RIT-PI-S]
MSTCWPTNSIKWAPLAHELPALIRPRYPALLLAAGLLAVAFACEAQADLGALPWVMLVAFVLASALDIRAARRLRLGEPHRALPQRLSAGQENTVEVTLENPHGRALRLQYDERLGDRLGFSHAVEVQGLPRRLKIPPRHAARFSYQLRPLNRGALMMGEAWLYVSGPLGLWEARQRFALPQRARAGTNLPVLTRLTQEASNQWRAQRLAADANGQADLARPGGLLIWLDTAPVMGSVQGEARALDYAMDAALALACAAQASGARVALHLSAGDSRRQLASAAGERQLEALHQVLEELQLSTHPTDYTAEAASLLQRHPGGDWVVLITRLPADGAALVGPLAEVARQHRLVIADIAEQRLLETCHRPIRTDADARAYCMAIPALGHREHVCAQLAAAGLEVMQAPGEHLASELVERYTKGCR